MSTTTEQELQTKTESETSCKDRLSLIFCPCKYYNDPKVTTTDCLSCGHETVLNDINIPPLIEMSGTYIGSPGSDPIPAWFVVLRTFLTSLMIYIWLYRFTTWAVRGHAGYFWIYWTQWIHTLLTISMILKNICTFTVNAKRRKDEDYNLNQSLSSDDPMWKLYIWNSVVTQMSLPAAAMLTLNYFAFVCKFKWSSPVRAMDSIQIHGGNFVIFWLNFYLSAERMHYKSFIWSGLLGTLYTIWTIIFEITINMNEEGDPYIYSTYDWSKSMTPIIYYFLSWVILTAFTAIATFTKNLILMCNRDTLFEWNEEASGGVEDNVLL
eukprot:518394_1